MIFCARATRGLRRMGGEPPDYPSCSQNAHDEAGGNGTRVVPCSRSAHDRNVLARRAQLNHYGCHSQRGEASKLGRITSMDVASFDARSKG